MNFKHGVMTLARFTYSNKESRQVHNPQTEAVTSHEAEQILHLKRLLVTLKQHYEKNLQSAQIQLQNEQNQRLALQQELEGAQTQWAESQKLHEEELQALQNQQLTLKELLKKLQDELKPLREQAAPPHSDMVAGRQRLEQLERTIPHLRSCVEGANLETEQLREQLNQAQKRVKNVELEMADSQQVAQREIEHLQQLLKVSQQQGEQPETVVSPTFSHSLRQELEVIKRHFDNENQETKALEVRYIEILNEKIGLEHQCKQLQLQLEHQSSNLNSFQTQLHQEKQALEYERDQQKILLDENETRLRVAQQHLAKKVKEAALLNEKVEEQQVHLADFLQNFEIQKTQNSQLQASLELYQRQEKRLQEQLHDALKGTENHISKWEEKYFQIYDKWQQSEDKIRDLKKFEEKHHQMQSFLANLGSFMGGTFNSSSSLQPNQDPAERPVRLHEPDTSEGCSTSKGEPRVEKYDLFGMRHFN